MIKVISEQIRYFLKKRVYIVSLILAGIAGYGYQLFHGTCGIDDISIDLYFEKGLGVAIGRWPYYLLNKCIPLAEYTPFLWDFITVLLLMLSAVTWCVLIRMIMRKELPIVCYIVFSAMFIDYSMIAEVFVFYLQNGLGFLYLLTAIALCGTYYIYGMKGVSNKRNVLWLKLLIIIFVTVAISFYESAANVFLSGAFLIVYLNVLNEKRNKENYKEVFLTLFWCVRTLVYAIVIRRLIRTVLMRMFGILPYTFYRSALSGTWNFKQGLQAVGEKLKDLIMGIFCDYFAMGTVYYPIFLFSIASILFLGYVIVRCVKDKNILQGILGLGFYFSLFALSIIQGEPLKYRSCQPFNIFVGIVLLGVVAGIWYKNRWIKIIGMACVTLCILNSAYDMTRWFSLDYRKTEYEMAIIDRIASDLKSGKYNISEKPIVVVGDFELDAALYEEYCVTEGDFGWELIKWSAQKCHRAVTDSYAYAQNSQSIIDWSVTAFTSYAGRNFPIKQLFEYRGYTFIWADSEISAKAFDKYYPLDKELYVEQMLELYTENYGPEEAYPNAGYIEENNDYIVIKM